MIPNFIQGNVAHYLKEIERMTMDRQDLFIRHTALEEKHKALQLAYDLLEARAAALVWAVPDETTIGELQQLALEFQELRRRDRERSDAGRRSMNAALAMPQLPRTLDDGSMTGP